MIFVENMTDDVIRSVEEVLKPFRQSLGYVKLKMDNPDRALTDFTMSMPHWSPIILGEFLRGAASCRPNTDFQFLMTITSDWKGEGQPFLSVSGYKLGIALANFLEKIQENNKRGAAMLAIRWAIVAASRIS